MLSASTKNRIASAVTTAGDCSWKPHPTCSPAARSASSAPASATNVTTTPAANARPATRRRGPSLCPGAASDSAFSDSTGNTQGIRLRISPPASASAIAAKSVMLVDAARGAPAFRSSTGTAPGCAFGPATTAPISGTSIVAAFTVVPPAASPLAAVITPFNCLNSPPCRLDTGSVST